MATPLIRRLHIDKSLFVPLVLLSIISLLVLYSASGNNLDSSIAQFFRLVVGFGIMFTVAQIRPETLYRWTPYIFGIGLTLLVIVLIMGVTGKGAQRWISLGIVNFQPSEIMKLGAPMMVAWFFSQRPLPPQLKQVAIAAAIILIPTALVAKQPDLGTALMIFSAGGFVLFLAGMGWRLIMTLVALAAASAPLVWTYYMHDYQRQRVLTLFDPGSDPLGTGYHTLQSMIAVGSGGVYGKGWLNGSQAHLNFLPESSTDFIFAVFAEEFGFLGILLIFTLYLFIVVRGIIIATYAQDTFTRLLAGSLTLTFFFYFFVNIGMVTGVLPVVGVPLPLISYGGSSLVTLMAAFGMLMSIHTHRRITQS
ncbi:MAG: rod shape-determining protein RodA [Gammaproteobacteria bacterium]|nr:MAG: rod shape-determining protein RodA [Gammaproteobacteria bacterium]